MIFLTFGTGMGAGLILDSKKLVICGLSLAAPSVLANQGPSKASAAEAASSNWDKRKPRRLWHLGSLPAIADPSRNWHPFRHST
ncbi:hypothetical protein J2736_001592 [Paenibacillus qinlingensis]|uniref:Uncharacterized protein n=2 Tax=Paenibacillus qinlingensis TaxID=1837343 RepID=A0ABU1NSI9_9BACL|nr:hypothetical protein [Paenibacillus qinlingensis]